MAKKLISIDDSKTGEAALPDAVNTALRATYGRVKTVNGQTPNAEGNVAIEAAAPSDTQLAAAVTTGETKTTLDSTYARWSAATPRFTGGFPEVKADSNETAVVYEPGGTTKAGWQVRVKGQGRLFHLTTHDNTFTSNIMAFGMDHGNSSFPTAILIANKAQSRGLHIHQQSTITQSASYGLYVVNESTATAAALFENKVAGAKAALAVVASAANPFDQLMTWTSVAGFAGCVRGDNGWIDWRTAITPGRFTTAQRPTGLGASTRGTFIYDTDLDRLVIYQGSTWRGVLTRPATAPTAIPDTSGVADLAALEAEVNKLKAALREAQVIAA